MNSHQRRKSRRYWAYQYEVMPRDWKVGVAMVAWCKEQFGPLWKERWHVRYVCHFPTEIIFWFRDSKDATWFKLMWL